MLGFWKNGNKTGPAKIVSKNKITYLLYDIMGNSTQINNYDEFNKILNEKGLIRYKECFDLSLNEICKIINNFFFSDYLLKKQKKIYFLINQCVEFVYSFYNEAMFIIV